MQAVQHVNPWHAGHALAKVSGVHAGAKALARPVHTVHASSVAWPAHQLSLLKVLVVPCIPP